MSESLKATKVPVFRKGMLYTDWRKEVEIWRATNDLRKVNKQVQAGLLFESLQGKQRETVLSELTVAEITGENGLQNIFTKLDAYFEGNKTKNAFQAHDDLMSFRRNSATSMEDFLIEFQLKVNKVEAAGTALPDGVLGYTLLNCANLSHDKVEICRATCTDLNFNTVKAQLEKIGLGSKQMSSSGDFSVNSEGSSNIKVENAYFGNCNPNNMNNNSSDSDSNECDDIYFSSAQWRQRNKFHKYQSQQLTSGNSQSSFQLNPTDKFGHVMGCDKCKCVYHWIIDCPYASDLEKNDVLRKKAFRNRNKYNSSQKPL